jgi:type II secretory ATPase GspE/PulE/Tfp pilus assembly ATPase PilB-like protein
MRLALTGHLILTTVHANTAIQALCRLLDLGVEASMLSATTRLLVGQRLVKRLCPRCRQPHRKSGSIFERYGRVVEMAARARVAGRMGEVTGAFFEAGGGCSACSRSGYAGRTGIFEFRDVRSAVADLLLRQRSRFDPAAAEAAFSAALLEGEISARSMREDGVVKASFGLTTPEEVFGATMDGDRAS